MALTFATCGAWCAFWQARVWHHSGDRHSPERDRARRLRPSTTAADHAVWRRLSMIIEGAAHLPMVLQSIRIRDDSSTSARRVHQPSRSLLAPLRRFMASFHFSSATIVSACFALSRRRPASAGVAVGPGYLRYGQPSGRRRSRLSGRGIVWARPGA